MKRVNLENGNYAISYYYDDNDESVAKEQATKCIVCEFDSNDKLIKEARFVLNTNEKSEADYGLKEYNNTNPAFFRKKR